MQPVSIDHEGRISRHFTTSACFRYYMVRMRVHWLLLSMLDCLLLSGCCENERRSEHFSPDGKWKYVTFSRNCGATTADNFQVSVLPATALMPTEAGNVFIADDNHGEAAFVADPEWLPPHTLQITYSTKARIFKKESRVAVVDVSYVRQP